MELKTVELRWFRSGECPRSITEWFHGGFWVGEAERRTDEYLLLADRGDIGMKRRAGVQLDLKLRTGTSASVMLPDGLDGPVEAWTKWSFPLGSDVSLPGDGSWVTVDKLRWSRFHAASGEGTSRSVPFDTEVAAGCAAELVHLVVGGDRAWSFGFEAFGECDRAALLAATCRALVDETPLDGISFTAGGAHSYPAWLAELAVAR